MHLFVDVTEPGIIFHALRMAGSVEKLGIHRTILHKRVGVGAVLRKTHPHYGSGVDYLLVDDAQQPLAAIERKTLSDLAKSVTVGADREKPRLFRQLDDLAALPRPMLLLEGEVPPLYARVEPVLLGIQLMCADRGIAVAYASTPSSTARLLLLRARRITNEGHLPSS